MSEYLTDGETASLTIRIPRNLREPVMKKATELRRYEFQRTYQRMPIQ